MGNICDVGKLATAVSRSNVVRLLPVRLRDVMPASIDSRVTLLLSYGRADAAALLGVSAGVLKAYACGRRRPPEARLARALANLPPPREPRVTIGCWPFLYGPVTRSTIAARRRAMDAVDREISLKKPLDMNTD